jgi:transcriptional regulator with XRE-family HTH domain
LEKRLSLRQFSEQLQCDPSQWSKIERGILAPPKSLVMLSRIAEILGIKEGTEDWTELNDFAALGAGRLPEDLLNDEELLKCLPLVFRTVRNTRPTEQELLNLADLLRRNIRR